MLLCMKHLMKHLLPLALLVVLPTGSRSHAPMTPMFKKATPVMIVERIEPVLPFWVERLGFAKTVDVPEGDHLGFAILVKDGVELMFQTWTSVQADAGPTVFRSQPRDHTPLYIEVADLASVQRALAKSDVLVEERKTFYGATETIVRAPGGQIVTFAEMSDEAK